MGFLGLVFGKRLSGSRVTVSDSILRVLKCEKANSLVFAVLLPHLTQTSCDMGCAKGVPEKFVFGPNLWTCQPRGSRTLYYCVSCARLIPKSLGQKLLRI